MTIDKYALLSVENYITHVYVVPARKTLPYKCAL